MSEPAINATIREFVRERLKAGADAKTVRSATIAAFVETFAAESPDKSFTETYRKQVTEVTDDALRSFLADASPKP